MGKKLDLDLTDDQLHELYVALERGRSSSVKVDRESLRVLLRDHGRLIAYYKLTN